MMKECATGYGLVEAPVWHKELGLLFSDIPNGGIYRLAKDGSVSTQVPKRRGVGGLALHEDDGLIMGGRDLVVSNIDGTDMRPLYLGADTPSGIGFNDMTTDSQGRIYVGSLGFRVNAGEEPKTGFLHMIDLDGSVKTLSDNVLLTNGMAFSPDGKRLYHNDSRRGIIRVYDVSPDGSLSDWRAFAKRPDETPDGMAVAVDGSVWVALARGGAVAVFDPDGNERKRIPTPLPMPTSVCFGGDDMRDLYVVTGSRGGPKENCGTVFVTRADVPGLALAPARMARPEQKP